MGKYIEGSDLEIPLETSEVYSSTSTAYSFVTASVVIRLVTRDVPQNGKK